MGRPAKIEENKKILYKRFVEGKTYRLIAKETNRVASTIHDICANPDRALGKKVKKK